jgi:hypothetical protein
MSRFSLIVLGVAAAAAIASPNPSFAECSGVAVRALVRDRQPAGAHQAEWSGLDDGGRLVASDTYFYRLRAEGSRGRSFERSKKIQVMR